ncbi:MAG: hypothetical protein ACYTJ0_11400 [Planctomycetota bacterium]|jgi:hypothetical protein
MVTWFPLPTVEIGPLQHRPPTSEAATRPALAYDYDDEDDEAFALDDLDDDEEYDSDDEDFFDDE